MSVPTVGSNVPVAASVAAGTTLTLTLTAGVAVGDVVLVFVAQTSGTVSTVADTQTNVWVALRASFVSASPVVSVYASVVTKAMVSTNTVTITLSGTIQGAVATMLQLTGVPENLVFVTGGTDVNSATNTGTSTSALATSLTTTHQDDLISVFITATFLAGALAATDFTSGSVNNSYTKSSGGVSTNGTSNCGLEICYKTVTAANPMLAQAPTFTLNTSRAWSTRLLLLSGVTARGSNGIYTRNGDAAGSTLVSTPGGGAVLNYGNVGRGLTDRAPKPHTGLVHTLLVKSGRYLVKAGSLRE